MPNQAFSPSDKKLVMSTLLKECDERDGIDDGMIFDVLGCAFKPEALTCKGNKDDSCLTPQQVGALHKTFSDVRDSRGKLVYSAYPYDTGITIEQGGFPGKLIKNPLSPTVPEPMSFDVDESAAAVAADALQMATDTDGLTNLTTFSGHGGKLLFYHGVSDSAFSALDTAVYYNKLMKDNGGADVVESWSRLYFVPGMGHCRGGPAALDNFALLAAAVDWVENGVAPEYVVAKGKAFPGRTRPLCAYPKHAQYNGTGNPDDASNFTCVK